MRPILFRTRFRVPIVYRGQFFMLCLTLWKQYFTLLSRLYENNDLKLLFTVSSVNSRLGSQSQPAPARVGRCDAWFFSTECMVDLRTYVINMSLDQTSEKHVYNSTSSYSNNVKGPTTTLYSRTNIYDCVALF